jgi:hypothetical protein
VPLSATLEGLVGASLAMLNDPEARPVAVGVKVTVMVQLALVARVAPQVLVCAYGAAAVIPAILSVELPLLVSVTSALALAPINMLPRFSVVGLSVTAGWTPVPLSEMVDGLVGASLRMVSVPLAAPVAVGEYVTVIVQLPLAANVAPQVLVWE